jgi:hypothetical protein
VASTAATGSTAGTASVATGVESTADTGSVATGGGAPADTGSTADIASVATGGGSTTGTGSDGSALGATSVPAGASRFGAGVTPLVGTGVVPPPGGNAGAAVRASSGVVVGPRGTGTVGGGCVVAVVALLVASPTGGGSVTAAANATPAGMAVIAKAKAHSMRTAVRTVCAGPRLAGWERPGASGLNSLERQDPTMPNASNCRKPPGVVMRRDALSIRKRASDDCSFKNSLVFVSRTAWYPFQKQPGIRFVTELQTRRLGSAGYDSGRRHSAAEARRRLRPSRGIADG